MIASLIVLFINIPPAKTLSVIVSQQELLRAAKNTAPAAGKIRKFIKLSIYIHFSH
jgi:hypothetical protein